MIRLATEADFPQLGRLVERASAELRAEFGTPDSSSVIMFGATFGVKNDQAVFVAETDGTLIAFVVWVWFPQTPPDYVDALGTWVHPNYRGRGLSGEIRRLAAQHCRAKGRKWALGNVAIANTAGVESAKMDGWQFIGYLGKRAL